MNIKKLLWIICGAAVSYLALAPRGPAEKAVYRWFLFKDWIGRKMAIDGDMSGISVRFLEFPARDGSKLSGAFFWNTANTSPDRLILYCHGNASNIQRRLPIIRLILRALPDAALFIFDYRGYGRSEGSPSAAHILEDGASAYQFVKGQGWTADRIVLYGESLGCAVACRLGAGHDVAGLILQSGFASLKRAAGEHLPLLRAYPMRFLWPKPDLDNSGVLEEGHPPLLILHGEKDETIPVHHAYRLWTAAREPKTLVVLPDATHMEFGGDEGVYVSAIAKFVLSLSQPKKVAYEAA